MRQGWLVIAVVFMFLQGCATSVAAPEYQTAEGFQGVPATARLLVVPMTATSQWHEPGIPQMTDILKAQLSARYQVSMLDAVRFQRHWSEAVNQVGGFFSSVNGTFHRERYLQAVRLFARQINPQGRYDVILFPALVDRTAESKGRYAHWDGVKRRHQNEGVQLADARWHGTTRGLSLELNAYDGEGAWAFTSYGGLVLPYYYAMEGRVPETHFKTTLFREKANLQHGVQVAVGQFAAGEPAR